MPRADGDLTRTRLLEAAGELFARAGYAATANKAICALAGADLAAINYHFGGRDGLYRAVLLEGYNQLIDLASLQDICTRKDAAADKLRAILGLVVDRLIEQRSWHGRVFAREILAPSAHMAELVRDGILPRFRLLSGVLSELTGIAPEHPALLRCVANVMAPCLMLLVIDRQVPTPFQALLTQPAEVLKDHLTRFALAGLKAVARHEASAQPVTGRRKALRVAKPRSA